MASNVSSMLNSRMRMTGMSSGLDVDGMVQQIMKTERFKVDKAKQNRQTLEWKRDNYREITNMLRGFKDDYFDVLKPSSNFRSPSAFASYKTSSSNESLVTVTGSAGATSSTHKITIESLAGNAGIIGVEGIVDPIKGTKVLDPGALQYSGKQLSVTLDGVSKTIELQDYASFADMESKLSTAVSNAFGAGKITVTAASGNVEFKAALNGSTLSIAETRNTFINSMGFVDGQTNFMTAGEIKNTADFSKISGDFKIKLGSTEKTITIGAQANFDDLMNAISSAINDPANFGPGQITVSKKVTGTGNSLIFRSDTGEDMTVTSGDTNSVLSSIGFTSGTKITGTSSIDIDLSKIVKGRTFYINGDKIDMDNAPATIGDLKTYIQNNITTPGVTVDNVGNKLIFKGAADITFKKGLEDSLDSLGFMATDAKSNRMKMDASLDSIKSYFKSDMIIADASQNVKFTINNVLIDVGKSYSTATMKDVMNAINGSEAGVQLAYDSLKDKFTLTSRTAGQGNSITYSDASTGLLKSMGIVDGTASDGTDAKFTLDGVANMLRPTNSFSIDGVNYNLKGADLNTEVTITVNSDPDALITKIKNFVNKYNEVVDKINGELSEKRDRAYQPLSDDQREAMKEDDITKWESKAKAGLLNNDGMLNNIVNGMRRALSDEITGATTSLAKIGITTGSYDMKGKLIIDETKLKTAITENADTVVQLFTQDSQYSYEYVMNTDSTKKSARYNEIGLAQRLYDIIQDSIRTTRDNGGKKGVLLETAGIQGDISEFQSNIVNQLREKDSLILTLNNKLQDKENKLYLRFSNLETALNRMNSQSSWLSQQMGGK